MRYITGAAVAALLLLVVFSLQRAGAQTSTAPGVVCAGQVTIPEGKVNPSFDINCPDVGPIDFVATINPGWDEKGHWVISVRGDSARINIHLNAPVVAGEGGDTLKVAWIGFTFHR